MPSSIINDSFFDRSLHAIREPAEASDRCFLRSLCIIGAGHDVVEFFVFDFCPSRHRPVDDRFELRVDGIKVDGAG